MKSVLLVSAVSGLAAAHFQLQYPDPVAKFVDDTEGDAPCGGPKIDFKNVKFVDFHVGGESLAMTSTHPQSKWLFRATTEDKSDPTWEQLYPIVLQSGLGAYCQPQVTVPESYIGKKGYVSVVSSAMDGLLYQCIAANFVEGKGDMPSACKNASSVKGSFSDDPKLSALVGKSSDSGATGSKTGDSTASQTSEAAKASHSNAASSLQGWSSGSGSAWGVMGLSIAALGGAFLL